MFNTAQKASTNKYSIRDFSASIPNHSTTDALPTPSDPFLMLVSALSAFGHSASCFRVPVPVDASAEAVGSDCFTPMLTLIQRGIKFFVQLHHFCPTIGAGRVCEQLSLCPAGFSETARKPLESALPATARTPTQAPAKRVGCQSHPLRH